MVVQNEMRSANLTWAYYKYGGTVHAFTLLENPLWNGMKNMVSTCSPAFLLQSLRNGSCVG